MSRLFNLYCFTAVATLSIVSCSTTRTKSDATQPSIENIEVSQTVEIDPSQEVETTTDQVHKEVKSENKAGNEPQEVVVAPEEPRFFFSDKQSSAVSTSEFKGVVMEDIALDLRKENSHYPADGHVTSPYGWRRGRMHSGTDIKAYKGDNIYAAFDGVVRLAKYYGAYGNCLVIRHYNGLETVYGHSSKLLVKPNDVVKAGDVIAYAGSTGRSTGSHLHFEVRANGNCINPTLVLDTNKREIRDTTLYITMRNGKIFASNNESEEEREAKIIDELSIRYHIVRSGDNLSSIAVRNYTTVTSICRLNGISSRSILRIGQRLIVRNGIKPPVKKTTTASTSETKKTSAAPATYNTTTYTIKSGDTLGKIAENHGTTVSEICRLNGISSRTTLQIGRKLKVRDSDSSTSSSSSSAQASSSSPVYYYVKSGDTLGRIAINNHTTIDKLCKLNGISRNSILSLKQRIRVR